MRSLLYSLAALSAIPLLASAHDVASAKEGAVTQESASESKSYRPDLRYGPLANMLKKYDTPFILYPYDTNYIMYTYTDDLNKEAISSYDWAENSNKDEVKFQISIAFPIVRGILGENTLLGMSYTQLSLWQALNGNESAPFRETNYEPQLFLGWVLNNDIGGWTFREAELGANHHSNGKADPTSRSWNRLYGRVMAQNGNWQVDLKSWWRIPESDSEDDNPDIIKYMGYYNTKIGYRWGDSVFSLKGGYNWNSGYGRAELGWSYPITTNVRFYTQVFSGYGESLIDYNFKQTRFGIGVMLNDIL